MRPLALQLSRLHLGESAHGTIPLSALDSIANLHHLPDCLLRQQILIVKVVEKNIEPLLHVVDLWLVLRGRDGLNAVDLGSE